MCRQRLAGFGRQPLGQPRLAKHEQEAGEQETTAHPADDDAAGLQHAALGVQPQRRSVGVTAAAWKTSAGAAARMPVALASNLNQTIKEYKQRGVFVIGLDGDGDVMLPEFTLADKPLLVVVGSEGKGLSRLVQENCDQVVSIPITAATESLNAGIAASVALYQISSMRS